MTAPLARLHPPTLREPRPEARGHHRPTPVSLLPLCRPVRPGDLTSLSLRAAPCSVLRLALPQSPSLTKRFCTGRDETERGIKSTGGSRNTPLQRWERRRVECTQESGPPRHHRERGERSCAAVRAAVSAFLFLRIPWLAWYLVRKAQTLVSPRPPQPPASCPLQFVRAALPAEGARDPGGAARGAREE